MADRKTQRETSRTGRAVEMHKAGAPVSQVARELGISTNVIYKALRLEREKLQADEDRREREIADELVTRRWAVIELPREYGPDGADWVRLSEVLRVLS